MWPKIDRRQEDRRAQDRRDSSRLNSSLVIVRSQPKSIKPADLLSDEEKNMLHEMFDG